MTAKNHTKFKYICLLVVLIFCACFTVACNDTDDNGKIYLQDNNFDVTVSDTADALEFAPVGFTPKYGVVFYVGTLISPENYTYLGQTLARQGYLAVFPKVKNNLAFSDYNPNIAALKKYENVKFFLAGHDMGGGAAVRHAMDYAKHNYFVAGVLLYAPTTFVHQKFEDGKLVFEDDGVTPVLEHFTIEDYSMPTLLLEVDEESRTQDIVIDVESHLNTSVTTKYTLTDSRSVYFNTMSLQSGSDELAAAQRLSTVTYTLSFLREVVNSFYAPN